jgi:tungstate transport system ATP-binding protein
MSSLLYSLQDVSIGYNRSFELDIQSLEIPPGGVFALLGPNGAGKSTLLRILHFLEPAHTGKIQFEGRTIIYPASLALRRRIAMVFQKPIMLAGSVRRNITYGMRLRGEVDPGRLQKLMDDLDLTELADEAAKTLSGGEAQRVALARALAVQPEVLLLDEPTANLDPHNIGLIENIIRQASTNGSTSVILVTHDVFQVRRLADFAAFIVGGRLVEIGEIDNFFERPTDPRTQAYLRGELVG